MIVLLIILSKSNPINISSIGFNKMGLKAQDILYVNVPKGLKPFIIFSQDMNEKISITLYKTDQIKEFKPKTKLLFFTSVESTIKIVSEHDYVYINIWIIPEQLCPVNSMVAQNGFSIDFNANPGTFLPAMSCIFSGSSGSKSLIHYGHQSSLKGNAYLITESYLKNAQKVIDSCINGNNCESSTDEPFFIIFNNTDSEIQFHLKHSDDEKEFKNCNADIVYGSSIGFMYQDCFPFSNCEIHWKCATKNSSQWVLIIIIFALITIGIWVSIKIYQNKDETIDPKPLIDT